MDMTFSREIDAHEHVGDFFVAVQEHAKLGPSRLLMACPSGPYSADDTGDHKWTLVFHTEQNEIVSVVVETAKDGWRVNEVIRDNLTPFAADQLRRRAEQVRQMYSMILAGAVPAFIQGARPQG